MKRNWIYIVCIALLGSSTMLSCDISSSRNYMGTMAGAEIGGVIGEALGWMSTSRHEGPGKAMLGTIVGTVAGAAIGNAITKDNQTQTVRVGRRDNVRDNVRYEEDYNPGYQIGGGSNYDGYTNRQNNYAGPSYGGSNSYSFLTISNVTYQDEDGDGRINRNETINIIYEVTNTSKNPVDDVELKIEALDGDKYFAVSPSNTAKIAAGECIRYKAKAFCKSIPSKSPTQFKLSASSRYAGSTSTILQIRMNK
ncbi:MAG: hypothetical protein J5720_05115 [Bacteroidaceae bacterium]|nr:hypothetical protein [Bacteroidaceae bacterium]